MKMSTDLGKDSIPSLVLRLAIPSMIAQFVNVLYSIIDRIYIGHIPEIGDLALAGVGVCGPIVTFLSSFGTLVGLGGSVIMGIHLGERNREKARQVLANAFLMLCCFSLALTVIFLFSKEKLLMWFGASSITFPYADTYMTIYTAGTFFALMAVGLNYFINCQGFPVAGMATVLIGAVSNILLDPLFIFVFKMDVAGAAIATVISQAFSCIWVLVFLTGKKTELRIQPKYMRLRGNIILPALALGLSNFVMQASESAISICFNSSLLKYGGDIAVGAMTILTSVMQFAMLPLQGLTQGGQPIISYNYGAGLASRVQKAFKLQTIACVSYSTLLWALAMCVPSLFVMIFTSDPQLTEISCWAMRIYLCGVFLMGIQTSCQQSFIALGNSKISSFLAVFRKIICLIPCIYILPNFFEDKVFAVFLAEPIADTIAVLTTSLLFYREFKKILKEMRENVVS